LPIQNDKEYLSSAEIVFNSKLKDDIRNNDQQNSSNDVSKRINDNHDMICDHASEQPLSCVETIGVRELTVGELLLGRQQQLNVLRRLKQRMQIEKRNSEHTLIGESSCGDWTRKKYQRTMTSLSDDADRPITALTLGELYRKSWAQRPAVKRFDANDFIRMHTAEIAKSNAALRRKRRITINKEKDLKSTCAESNSTGAAECSLYKLFSMNFSYSTTDPCKVDTPDSDVQRSTDTTCPSSQPQSQSSSTNFTSEASVHNVAQRKSSSVADEIPVSQLLSTPLAPNVFLETMSWMQRQSELADQESFEEYLSATISHLSSGTAFDPNSVRILFRVLFHEI
uniref:Uncharacterized protein n=1 Tax=Toxocara canis TaxID=6265 RepID=A0A183U2Y2_TOXCA